jgi:dihydrofolate synthase/folylpolyglutamate synthase|tara:strand:- start:180 stop:1532 length:1353 start_codon:yes stop_codon:yes gene_type:complete
MTFLRTKGPTDEMHLKPGVGGSLDSWLTWLERGRADEIDLGLGRCEQVALNLNLNLTKLEPSVVTVAGTNGKGSSVSLLEAILLEAGYRTGTYSSPHISCFNERIKLSGINIDDHLLCDAFLRVSLVEGAEQLTYFEFITLAALVIFASADIDFMILEVGLGGRLDAVNIVPPDIALITMIGIDHTEWLGDTRELIGFEKAGIMRTGKPVVCSDKMVTESIYKHAHELSSPLFLLGVDYYYEHGDSGWVWWTDNCLLDELPEPILAGNHQLRNAAGVLKVVDLLSETHSITEENIQQGLKGSSLKGRFEKPYRNLNLFLDVAHNVDGAYALASNLHSAAEVGETHMIVGMLKTKSAIDFFRPLLPIADDWSFISIPSTKASDPRLLQDALKKISKKAKSDCFDSFEHAFDSIFLNMGIGDRIIVTGSFITVAEATAFLQKRLFYEHKMAQ